MQRFRGDLHESSPRHVYALMFVTDLQSDVCSLSDGLMSDGPLSKRPIQPLPQALQQKTGSGSLPPPRPSSADRRFSAVFLPVSADRPCPAQRGQKNAVK